MARRDNTSDSADSALIHRDDLFARASRHARALVPDDRGRARVREVVGDIAKLHEEGVDIERDDYVPRLNKLTNLMDVFFECPDHKHKCVSSAILGSGGVND